MCVKHGEDLNLDFSLTPWYMLTVNQTCSDSQQ